MGRGGEEGRRGGEEGVEDGYASVSEYVRGMRVCESETRCIIHLVRDTGVQLASPVLYDAPGHPPQSL